MSFLLACPFCGPRPVDEFTCFGEVTTRPTGSPTLRELTDYVYFRDNVAGVQRFARVGDITADALHLHLDVNLVAPVLLTQALVPALAQSRGNVVTIASISAVTAQGYNSVYCASKAGLLMAMRSMAIELAKVRVRVNCVLPGPVLLPPDLPEAERREAIDATLVRREGRPENVAQAVLFLVENDFVTGACIPRAAGGDMYNVLNNAMCFEYEGHGLGFRIMWK